MTIVSVKGPYTSKEIGDIYRDMTRNTFYSGDYNAEETVPSAYVAMMNIVAQIFNLQPGAQVFDLGSGKGHLVLSMLKHGLRAKGIEFSASMINSVQPTERQNFLLVNSLREVDLSPIDLLTSMEVFEHLPMAIIVENLEYIREVFRGYVFLTIPSSGYDRTLPQLGHVESDEHRLAAMSSNVVCPYLVMEDGYPSGGHITLASYRWWEDFFLTQGLARQTALERAYGRFVPDLFAQNLMWCCYILRALGPHEIAFGRGWHEREGSFRWSGPDAELQFVSERERLKLRCELTLPDVNVMTDAQLDYSVEQLDIVDDYRIVGRTVASGRIDLNGPGRTRHLEIPIRRRPAKSSAGPFPRKDGALKTFRAYKVRFHTPLWTPSDHGGSPDVRPLGFCFHNVHVSAP